MNDYAVFLCDTTWTILKPLRLPAGRQLTPGARLTDWLADPEQLADPSFFDGQVQRFVVLQLNDGQGIPALFSLHASHVLAILAHVRSEEDFIFLCRVQERCIGWANEAFQDYQDEYYRIQQMNNQLLNSQRALMKSNQRYKQVLAEVRDANDLITLLEQDEVTPLLRSSALHHKARERMDAAPGQTFALLVIDLEPLKLVNELFDRAAGDRLLREYSLLLSGLVPSDAVILAHAAGSLFVVFAPEDLHFPETVQTHTNTFLADYPLPMELHAKLGVCTAEAGTTSSEEMFDRARLALDTLHGASGMAVYNDALHQKILLQHKLLDSIRPAIQNRELKLYLQPKVHLRDGSVFGAEALVRWIHPELGFVPPMQFIPLLEQQGAIYEVDKFIWEEACRVLALRRDMGLPPRTISVNVARSEFYQPDLLDVLQAMLHKHGLTPDLLHLEILERAYTKDSDQLFQVLTRLRQNGFCIEMDDFGVGESSLAMLTELPVDIIKLDRQFLLSTLKNPRHAEVIRCIVQLAQALDIGVIAEGVETAEQADLLQSLGCTLGQGYFYGKPEPAENFLNP